MEKEEQGSKNIRQNDEDLPLDKVLKHRHQGKKLPSRGSSDSRDKDATYLTKLKPISKDNIQQPQQQKPQVSSTDLTKQLIFNPSLGLKETQQLMIKLKNIKSLKYEKLTEKVRECLVQTIFQNNYPRFVLIINAYNPMTVSTHLIAAIFTGFQHTWKREKFDSINCFTNFLKLYCQQIPNCLNKRFAKWLCSRAKQNQAIYTTFRKKVLEHVQEVIKKANRQRSTENQKIIGLIVYFELMGEVDSKQLMRIVPLQKINQYIDDDNLPQNNALNKNNKQHPLKQTKQELPNIQNPPMQPQQNQKPLSDPQNHPLIPPLVHSSILQLLRQNNLKQIQKIIRSYKVPYTLYPEFVQKLQLKYLQYIERTYPLFVVDELIHGKLNLVENFVDMCLKRKKYQAVQHFVNKYKLRGVTEPDRQKIFMNPLKHQDSFGPTESHVLNQVAPNHFVTLSDFNISKKQVIWIDSTTIHQKSYAHHLIKLLQVKEVGLDSESTSAIHVFQKARLELIQLYEPESNVVVLFDVRDFKTEKKKRVRKVESERNEATRGNSLGEAINVQEEEDNEQEQKAQNNMQSKIENRSQKSSQQISQSIPYQKSWSKFTKVLQHIFTKATIIGHCLHADLGDIIQQLNLPVNHKKVSFIDSQQQFRKHFPHEIKSKLSFLTQKRYGKELSKYEQCSAWDKRPLRDAQKHYAALDAVLPYMLVKWMKGNCEKK